ncbi:uncharacterized protein M6B38_391460 [Iris pallida]|uniref:WRC domain-containing protein n=1 Tax=Iris pallida TaxID=29817 RepID=A0AAX6FYI3_IRIPA|nr:uncharacterized protein M6B38_391460 [Iris pallida]
MDRFFCQLNCSPWDVMDYSNFFYFQQEGGEKGMEDIMGNVFGFGDDQGILGISEASMRSVVVAEDENDSNQKKVKKRRRRKKEEENDDDEDGKEKTSNVVTIIAKSVGVGLGVDNVSRICKKNDGKGWHCNRPANPHHTLCDHHLTQLRSYSSTRYNSSSSNNIAREEAVDNRDPVKNQKKDDVSRVKTTRRPKTKAPAAVAGSKSAGDCYYYYSGFGLQGGKSRSDGGRKEEDVEAKELESESGDGGSDAPIAIDDLDNDTVEDDENVKIVGNVVNNKGRIRRNKRGRKPIKARSLKSLM